MASKRSGKRGKAGVPQELNPSDTGGTVDESAEPRTPDVECPNPSISHAPPVSSAAQHDTAAGQAPGQKQGRQYEKWTAEEEQSFFRGLKGVAGREAQVCVAAIAKRIPTKDYDQVRHYYYRLRNKITKMAGPDRILQSDAELHKAMGKLYTVCVDRGCQGTSLLPFQLKPRHKKELTAVIQKTVDRLIRQRGKERPVAGKRKAASGTEETGEGGKRAKGGAAAAQHGLAAQGGSASLDLLAAIAGQHASPPQPAAGGSMQEGCAAVPASEAVHASSRQDRRPDVDSGAHGSLPGSSGTDGSHFLQSGQPAQGTAAAQAPAAQLALQLGPLSDHTKQLLEQSGFNPFLELDCSAKRKVKSVLQHCNNKWATAADCAELGASLRLHAAGCASLQSWGMEEGAVLLGEVFAALGSPSPFKLFYSWHAPGEQLHSAQPALNATTTGQPAAPCPAAPSSLSWQRPCSEPHDAQNAAASSYQPSADAQHSMVQERNAAAAALDDFPDLELPASITGGTPSASCGLGGAADDALFDFGDLELADDVSFLSHVEPPHPTASPCEDPVGSSQAAAHLEQPDAAAAASTQHERPSAEEVVLGFPRLGTVEGTPVEGFQHVAGAEQSQEPAQQPLQVAASSRQEAEGKVPAASECARSGRQNSLASPSSAIAPNSERLAVQDTSRAAPNASMHQAWGSSGQPQGSTTGIFSGDGPLSWDLPEEPQGSGRDKLALEEVGRPQGFEQLELYGNEDTCDGFARLFGVPCSAPAPREAQQSNVVADEALRKNRWSSGEASLKGWQVGSGAARQTSSVSEEASTARGMSVSPSFSNGDFDCTASGDADTDAGSSQLLAFLDSLPDHTLGDLGDMLPESLDAAPKVPEAAPAPSTAPTATHPISFAGMLSTAVVQPSAGPATSVVMGRGSEPATSASQDAEPFNFPTMARHEPPPQAGGCAGNISKGVAANPQPELEFDVGPRFDYAFELDSMLIMGSRDSWAVGCSGLGEGVVDTHPAGLLGSKPLHELFPIA